MTPCRLPCALLALVATAACGRAAGDSSTRAVTFTRDIAPVIFDHCAPCHRPGEAGPFSLLAYDDVHRRARQIAEVTADRFMPPWLPEPGHGEFLGERRLSDEQIALIRRWVDGGSVEGDPRDLPPLPRFAAGWQLGQPDVVVRMDEPFEVPAEGTDLFRKFVLPIPVSEPRYVDGVEFRSDNPRLVHHAVIRIDRTRQARDVARLDRDPGFGGMLFEEDGSESPAGHFLGWTPGHVPARSSAGLAWRLLPATDLVLELHLQPTGKPEPLQASVGLYFTDRAPARTPVGLQLGVYTIDIPAGANRHQVEDRYTLPVDVDVFSVYPHAHYLCREAHAFATLPGGSTRWLVRIDDWNFNWQDEYRYREPVFLPAGSIVTMRYVYDNSEANTQNPHRPPARVRYGGRSTDEMGNLWMQVAPRRPADLARLVADSGQKVTARHIAGYEKLLETTPGHAGLLRALGSSYLRIGDAERAVATLERALSGAPGDAFTHYNLAHEAGARGDHRAAMRHLREAIRLIPDYAEAHNNLGLILRADGRLSEAITHFREALRVDPGYDLALNNLGSALRAAGRTDDAIAAYRRALAASPDFVDARYNLALAFQVEGRTDDAVAEYRRVLDRESSHAAAAANLAWILATRSDAARRDPAAALPLAERAADLTDRRDASVLDTLAAVYAALGRFDDAVAAGRRARDLAIAAGAHGLADEIRQRISLYERRTAHIEK